MSKRLDTSGRNFKWMIYLVDVVILLVVFAVFVTYVVEAMGWRNYEGDSRFYWDRFGHIFVFLLSYIVAITAIPIRTKDIDSMMETFIRAASQVVVMYVFFTFSVAILFHTFPGHLLLYSGVVNGILICLSHCLITKAVQHQRKKPQNTINVVMVGLDRNNLTLYYQLKDGYSTFSYNILGFFASQYIDLLPKESTYLGEIDGVKDYLLTHSVQEVYCSVNPLENKELVDGMVKMCEDNFISFYYVPNMDGYPRRQMNVTKYDNVTLITVHNEPLSDPYKRFVKRLFDIVVSGLFLITFYPIIWVVVAIGTKLSSPGPVLFRQQRTGYNGKPFTMLKFRSMRVNDDSDRLQATEDDPRKTKFGDFLRRTSLDELPQFINVFRGDMSIVGPRPHMELHTQMYKELVDEYLVRHLCKPGITGWAQVNGCRGETKTVEEMDERVRNDIWYIEHWSLLLDMRILLKTVFQIFKGDAQAY